ncbi:MAG TPA: hypothetical protein VK634_09670 [Reyranella sp.]|nr:hypothetical protein [Reyranella sp.]
MRERQGLTLRMGRGVSGHQQLIQLAHIVGPFAASAHDGGVEFFAHRLQLDLFLVISEVEEIL